MDIKGREVIPLDLPQARQIIKEMGNRVDAVAVSGYASVRNPRQELIVKKLVKESLGIPVVCAHELSGHLGFEERTSTAVFNARLIPVIKQLIQAVKIVLKSKRIEAPIMIVKGDGSLMGEEYALERPIETILSGPAASVIGGSFLSKEKDALILDMGGTTTDVAILNGGKVKLNNDGAVIGGVKTRVRAAEILTFGIGGDSYIRIDKEKNLLIGPNRAQPLCVAAEFFPWLVKELMEAAVGSAGELPHIQVSECFMVLHASKHKNLSVPETEILSILKDAPHSLFYIINRMQNKNELRVIEEMTEKGILMRIAVTPTDVLHVTGSYCKWNAKASHLGILLLAGQMKLTQDEVIKDIIDLMGEKLMAACQALDINNISEKQVVAIGNPVQAWMPEVCSRLGRRLMIPEHSEVANAVGAAVGQVMYEAQVLIRLDHQNNQYIVYSPWERKVMDTLEEAKSYTRPLLMDFVREMLEKAGALDSQIIINEEEVHTTNMDECSADFVEIRLNAIGIGSPDWA